MAFRPRGSLIASGEPPGDPVGGCPVPSTDEGEADVRHTERTLAGRIPGHASTRTPHSCDAHRETRKSSIASYPACFEAQHGWPPTRTGGLDWSYVTILTRCALSRPEQAQTRRTVVSERSITAGPRPLLLVQSGPQAEEGPGRRSSLGTSAGRS